LKRRAAHFVPPRAVHIRYYNCASSTD